MQTAVLSFLLCAVSVGAGCTSDESGGSLSPSEGKADANQAFGAELDVAVVSTAMDMSVGGADAGTPTDGMGSMTTDSETESLLSDVGFGEGDGEDTFSTDRGKKPAFNLLRGALEKDVIYVSEGPADKNVSGVSKLFLGQNPVEGVQTCAPESFGDIHCEESEFQ